MDTVKPKRFSFAGFSSSLSRSLSFNSVSKKEPTTISTIDNDQVDEKLDDRKIKRNLKSKSLYIKSFKKVAQEDKPIKTEYDPSEAVQKDSKEIRNSIRRSLSAVLYTTPHKLEEKKSNQLVPILVTSQLSESVGGILIDEKEATKKENVTVKKKLPVEYDNTLEVFDKDNSVTIVWQGYGYKINGDDKEIISELFVNNNEILSKDLQSRFENQVWDSYRGLIHPIHLFETNKDDVINKGKWTGLSVQELRRYYDNYGSMMLKIREARMLQQQKQYHGTPNVKNEWIIPNVN